MIYAVKCIEMPTLEFAFREHFVRFLQGQKVINKENRRKIFMQMRDIMKSVHVLSRYWTVPLDIMAIGDGHDINIGRP